MSFGAHAGQLLLSLDEMRPDDLPEEITRERKPSTFDLTFCHEYIVGGEKDATEAYRRAREIHGMSPATSSGASTQASKLMKRRDIANTIDYMRASMARSADLTRAEWLNAKRLVLHASLSKIPMRKTIIATVVERAEGEDDEALRSKLTTDVMVYDYNLPVAKGIVELMGRALKQYTDKVEHGGDEGLLGMLSGMISPTDGPPATRCDDG